jgi:hypothetical protein
MVQARTLWLAIRVLVTSPIISGYALDLVPFTSVCRVVAAAGPACSGLHGAPWCVFS